ncbi:MAG: DEAD/DEAH box helicase [gamma proteobacterium symbiont of Bathyaustriella thionipta]|nr:DEAD/DEAH box helicase [gamma proteobacterium symbiont of Bathyaustriella thionipta]
MSEQHLTDTRFDSFALSADLLRGLQDAGMTQCTPIQAQSIPLALQGKDIAGQAQTGTGKTAAFLVPVFQYLLNHPAPEKRRPNQPRVLIIAPTRELAVQIAKDAESLGKHLPFITAAVFGGTGYQSQREKLQSGVDLLIGTPGRLIDYLKQGVYDLKALQALVLDEADRMFDLGFIKDIRFMLQRMPAPEKRLSMLFSATLSYRVTDLAYEHMNHPQEIKIETEQVTADRIRQVAYMVANDEKIPLLLGLIKGLQEYRAIIFVNTKRVSEKVWGFLEGNGIKSAILSGDVPQNKRLSLLKAFQSNELPVLVATDVAARGLHIENVTHVFNFDLPDDAEDYVHRIGRTGRAGASGSAISFVCETYAFSLPDIEKYIQSKIDIGALSSDLLFKTDPKSRIYPPRRERRHDDKRSRGRHNKSHGSQHRQHENRGHKKHHHKAK